MTCPSQPTYVDSPPRGAEPRTKSAPRSRRVRIASAAPTIARVYDRLEPSPPPKRPPGPIRTGGPPGPATSGGASRPPDARSWKDSHRPGKSQEIVSREDGTADRHVRVALNPPHDWSSIGSRDVVVVADRPCPDRDIRGRVWTRVVEAASGRTFED